MLAGWLADCWAYMCSLFGLSGADWRLVQRPGSDALAGEHEQISLMAATAAAAAATAESEALSRHGGQDVGRRLTSSSSAQGKLAGAIATVV